MNVIERFIYVGATCYDFKTEQGNRLQLTKVSLIPLEMPKKDNVTGFSIDVFNADYSLFDKLRKYAPMKPYEFSLDVDTSGKTPKIRVLDVMGEVKAA